MATNNTFKTIQTSIFAPANYSIVASIAIHGLILGVILPRTDWNGNQNKNLQSTRVIELNEIEQTRLPNLSSSSSQGGAISSLPQLPPLNSPPTVNSFLQIPSVPPVPRSIQIPVASLSLPPRPPVTLSSSQTPVSPSVYSSGSSPKFGIYNYGGSIPKPSKLPAPPPLPSFNSESFSLNTPPSPESIAQRQLEIAALSSQQELESEQRRVNVRADQYQEQLTRADIISSSLPSLNEYDANPRNLINNRNRTSQAISPESSNLSNLPSPSLTNQGNGRNYVNLPSPFTNNQGENTPISVTQNSVTPNQTQVAINSTTVEGENASRLADQLQKHSVNTTNEEATKNDLDWRIQTGVANPSFLTIAGVYPKDACVGKLEGSATYGVVVNPNGGVKDLRLIKSSGYGIFNQQALKQIQTENIALSNDKAPAYLVNVNFKYDPQNCPSLNVTNVEQVETTPSSNPQSVTENTPKPEQNSTPSTSKNSNPSSETEVVKTTNSQPPVGSEEKTKPVTEVENQTQKVKPTVTNSQPPIVAIEEKEKTNSEVENQTPEVNNSQPEEKPSPSEQTNQSSSPEVEQK